MRILRVSDAARTLGCSETWLRRAERSGRIPKARRDVNGWRVYTVEDVSVLRRCLFPDLPDGDGVVGQHESLA